MVFQRSLSSLKAVFQRPYFRMFSKQYGSNKESYHRSLKYFVLFHSFELLCDIQSVSMTSKQTSKRLRGRNKKLNPGDNFVSDINLPPSDRLRPEMVRLTPWPPCSPLTLILWSCSTLKLSAEMTCPSLDQVTTLPSDNKEN